MGRPAELLAPGPMRGDGFGPIETGSGAEIFPEEHLTTWLECRRRRWSELKTVLRSIDWDAIGKAAGVPIRGRFKIAVSRAIARFADQRLYEAHQIEVAKVRDFETEITAAARRIVEALKKIAPVEFDPKRGALLHHTAERILKSSSGYNFPSPALKLGTFVRTATEITQSTAEPVVHIDRQRAWSNFIADLAKAWRTRLGLVPTARKDTALCQSSPFVEAVKIINRGLPAQGRERLPSDGGLATQIAAVLRSTTGPAKGASGGAPPRSALNTLGQTQSNEPLPWYRTGRVSGKS